MKKTLRLRGLDCAVCATELERLVAKVSGVENVSVSFILQRLVVEYTDESVLENVVKTVNGFEDVRVIDAPTEEKVRKKDWIFIVSSAVLLLVGVLLAPTWEIVSYICYGVAYLTVGFPVLVATLKNVVRGRVFDENFLMAVASVGAVFLGEYIESVAIMWLYCLGEKLQSLAVRSSRGSLTALLALKSEKTDVLRLENGKTVYKSLAPEQIQIGDKLLIKTGERVPVDGVLLGNGAKIDAKALTGESALKTVARGEEILSGCVNVGAVFQMQATRVYEESAVGRILDMVQNATAGKAKPEKFITKFAKIYTPIVCVLALLLATVAPFLNGLVNGVGFRFVNGTRWLYSALTFLVVSCPCALVISVPLSYFTGIGACAKKGILVKGATHLDVLARVDTFAFDKTGTLTEGNFEICGVYPNGKTEQELLALAGALERYSAHPIAKAFTGKGDEYALSEIREYSGRGLSALIDGELLLVGSARLLLENGVAFAPMDSAYTLVFVALGGIYVGAIEIGDKTRKQARDALLALQKQGVKRVLMLTGDMEKRAKRVAEEVGVREVYAELLPDEKLQTATSLQAQGTLAYVGDGINDAPVMTVANCSFSMGKLGSATAVEASDFVLVSDDLLALPKARRIAQKTRKIVLENIVFSIAMKTVFMLLGAFNVLPLGIAVFADVGVMLLAVFNAFRVRN